MIWNAARSARAWLDAANGTDQTELTCRILKLTEEAGEAAGAWIGVLGQSPRKGVTHSLTKRWPPSWPTWCSPRWSPSRVWGLDARSVVTACAAKVESRIAQ